ncbi:MAG: sensor histidine kinase [Lachnospiraceae bacterium]
MEQENTQKAPHRGAIHIQKKIRRVFLLALLLPMLVLAGLLVWVEDAQSVQRYQNLVTAENTRVRSQLYSVTTSLYQSTQAVATNLTYRRMLSASSFGGTERSRYEALESDLDTLWHNLVALRSIAVYTDNPNIPDGNYIHSTDLASQDWYSASDVGDRWCLSGAALNASETRPELTFVRRINLGSRSWHAYLVAHVSDDYLRNAVLITDYDVRVSFRGEDTAFFASSSHHVGVPMPEAEKDRNPDDQDGILSVDGSQVIGASHVLELYNTKQQLTVVTGDPGALPAIRREGLLLTLIVLVAILIPSLLILWFSRDLSERILALRGAMHQVSLGDYQLDGEISRAKARGDDELTDTYRDLLTTASNIRAREKEYYAVQIRQQEMEFKMLASQINPHFLYNTLETIRMQAFANRDRDTASSIMLLSNSMHYVLENIGTKLVPIQRELDQVERYLKIQHLRFGERVTWDFYPAQDIDTQHTAILPLLIQPIVENAVNYGIEPRIGTGHVSIILERQGGTISITVRDNGSGMEEAKLREVEERIHQPEQVFGRSIGLANIHHRIQALYGPEYGMTIRSAPGKGTSVEITIAAQKI